MAIIVGLYSPSNNDSLPVYHINHMFATFLKLFSLKISTHKQSVQVAENFPTCQNKSYLYMGLKSKLIKIFDTIK